MVLFAVAFFAILIAWSFLSHALDLVAKLPVLSTVNAWPDQGHKDGQQGAQSKYKAAGIAPPEE